MEKVLLAYWPEGGNVENAAAKFAEKFKGELFEMKPVVEITKDDLESASNILLGGSTVGSHVWEDANDSNKWFEFFKKLDEVELSEKTFAFFGLGDHILYPHHFVDGLGVFQNEIEKREGKIIGHTGPEGYKFSDSDGFDNGVFFGLPLDEDQEPEKTDERINNWLERIKPLFK